MKLLVLDGNSILNRAYYGIKLLTTKDGQYTNGIYGFLTTFEKVKELIKPDYVAIAFDLKKPTFRHKMYEAYKGQRKGMPEELAQQMPVLKELLKLLGYKIVVCQGYEADDILGTLAKACEETGNECVLATGDRDSLQLVSPSVTVRLTVTKMGRPEATLYDEVQIMETYGVKPKQLIDIKAIQGDTSDNIPGVKGIGQKGAADLIQRFGNLDYIYDNIDTIDVKPGIRKKLIEDKESAFLSRKLGEIYTDVPIEKDLQAYTPQPADTNGAVRLMAKLEFFSLIEKMGLRNDAVITNEVTQEDAVEKPVETIDTKQLADMVNKNDRAVFIGVYDNKEIKEIAFDIGNKIVLCNNMDKKTAQAIFENDKTEKITHNIKPLFAVLDKMGVGLQGKTFDSVLGAYLLNPSASGYDV
ncbi:MAG TPA: DNA polymerase I, partial [Clostridiales bacterium]|nr:DNA polymerase I [Clostridiales bacterium]